MKSNWQQSIYDHLHVVAERELSKEAVGHSLQPTLIVHDAYLKLLDQRNIDPADRSQVLAAGAVIIRRLLVDYARKRKALKRDSGKKCNLPWHITVAADANTLDVVELDDALNLLAMNSERAAKVVEMRFFGGLTEQEIAEQLGVSLRTVNRDWQYAKAWLYSKLSDVTASE